MNSNLFSRWMFFFLLTSFLGGRDAGGKEPMSDFEFFFCLFSLV